MRYHFSPARDHDSPHLQLDESWRGYGLLADLAYASLARLRACETYGVLFVIRLKDNWKPKVDYIARGQVTREFFPAPTSMLSWTTTRWCLMAAPLTPMSTSVEPRIRCRSASSGSRARKATASFLTNLPPRLGPLQVADLYRVRWEVELSINWTSRCTAWPRSMPSGPAP